MTEINKLEIKHIAPYLPYGLKVQRPDGKTILDVDGVFGTLIMHKVEDDVNYSSLSGCKPLLRPMSDLYKEREGKIDIVELAKIGTGCKDWIVKEYAPMIGGKIKLKSYPIAFNEEFNLRFHYKDGSLFLYSMADATNEYLVDQLALFEYLFSHHYDIFGLIDQNLAINLNEIE